MKIKKLLRSALCAFTAAVVGVTAFVFPAAAETVEWDGVSDILSGTNYTVNSSIKVNDSLYIPEGTKLSVKKGGELIFALDSNVEVDGTLNVAIGGTVTNSAFFSEGTTGVINVYGTFLSSISADVQLRGAVNVYNCGDLRFSSKVGIYKTASIYDNGSIIFLKSSVTKSSAPISVTKKGELHVQGELSVTVSGSIESRGYMTVGKNGILKNSGKITLGASSDYNRFGDVYNTKNGQFIDNRPLFEYETMTVSTIVDEPDVMLYGIDVSYANGTINWQKVAASGVDFAMIRAARSGVSSASPRKLDTSFEYNIKNATANGIDVGVYFFCYSTTVKDAREDAEFLVEALKNYDITYPIVLDIEPDYVSQPQIAKIMEKMTIDEYTDMVEAFFEVLMENGYFPMLYSYKSWFQTKFDTRILEKYAVWLAEIAKEPSYEGGFYMWQYSWKGKVSGISGDVDLDVCYRDFPSILKKNKLNNLG